ncbi:MAG: HEAT repeat domain-containing protein [Planctomycetota bacterium]
MISQIAFALAVAAAAPRDYGFTTDAGRLKADAVRELVAQLGDPRKGREAAQRLARFGQSAVEPTIAALGSKKLQVRFYAATVLDIIGDEAGTKALSQTLSNSKEDPIVRTIAARAMGRADYSPATGVLLELARTHSADASGERGDSAAADVSQPRRRGQDGESGEEDVLAGNEDFRFEVIRALAYMGAGEADGLLVSALSDPSARIRRVAAEGLGDHRVIAALGALRGRLEDPDGAAAAAAAKAVGKMGRRAAAAIPDLVEALERKDTRVRRAVMGALALTTGRSHRTPERWRKWWKERNASRPGPGKAKPEEEDFPLPAVLATEIFRQRGTDPRGSERPPREPASERRNVPPALRKPWETAEEGETDAPASRD